MSERIWKLIGGNRGVVYVFLLVGVGYISGEN